MNRILRYISSTAQTAHCALVFRASNRAGQVLEEQFGDALKKITAVTDRHAAYFALDFSKMEHVLFLSNSPDKNIADGYLNVKEQISGYSRIK